MLLSLLKSLTGRREGRLHRDTRSLPAVTPLRLHIGGQISHPDWKIMDVRPGPIVDYVGHCRDLSCFEDESVTEIYASHVVEHLGYMHELSTALDEFNRVLVRGGMVRISVPDLPTLCALYLDPELDAAERFHVMRMMFGGQINSADYHYVGFNLEFLAACLQKSGFVDIMRVAGFGIFDDVSNLIFKGRPISLNVRACKLKQA